MTKFVKDMTEEELRPEVYRLRLKMVDAHRKIKGREAIIKHLEQVDHKRIIDAVKEAMRAAGIL
jgi:hypothetical protein